MIDEQSVDTIFIDRDDYQFDEIDAAMRRHMFDGIKARAREMNIKVRGIQYRASSSGRVHVKIQADPIPVVWSLVFRARCGDDPGRLASDIRRCIMDEGKTDRCNRIFSSKVVFDTGEIRKAGDWCPLK